jgi:hypothetical protein
MYTVGCFIQVRSDKPDAHFWPHLAQNRGPRTKKVREAPAESTKPLI